jgi:serine/threonine-protein kinase
MLRRGQRLGRYEILETLPETGGMSILYKARNVEDGSRVAVKIPHPRLWDSPRLILRFAREGEALRKLRHRNIVPVLSVASQDGLPYIVMEYLSGDSLGQLMYKKLYKKEKFSLEEVLNFLRPIADALDYCHSQRVIHCDVKPGNIRITPQGSPVLIDFGIVQSDDCTVFDDGRTPVTPHYTSPEQARGLAATAQSDQYSLAILAYEMLTGHVPFDGNSQKVLAQQRDAEPPLPSDWSQPLKNVMRRALAKAPNERFRSCLEFLQALENPAQKYPPLLASLPPTTAPSDFKAEQETAEPPRAPGRYFSVPTEGSQE